jgi:hypothetical protein
MSTVDYDYKSQKSDTGESYSSLMSVVSYLTEFMGGGAYSPLWLPQASIARDDTYILGSQVPELHPLRLSLLVL